MPDHLSLFDALSAVPDPRKPRGCRHPSGALLRAVAMAYVCGESKVEDVARFIAFHWDDLKEELGFTRKQAPDRTTYSRLLGRLDPAAFAAAVTRWLTGLIEDEALHVAIDGKACRQAWSEDEDVPGSLLMLNAYETTTRTLLRQWLIAKDKSELSTLRDVLKELLASFPGIGLLTLDAFYADKTLLDQIVKAKRRYLVRIKDNQPGVLEACRAGLAQKTSVTALAQSAEKRGSTSLRGGSGRTKTQDDISVIVSACPAPRWRSGLSGVKSHPAG